MNGNDLHTADLQRYFGFLEAQHGFQLLQYSEEPRAFDNFAATFARGDTAIQITRDRSQVFVALRSGAGAWSSVPDLLEQLGVPRSRYPTEDELWTGYDIANQSFDLRQHLADLLRLLTR